MSETRIIIKTFIERVAEDAKDKDRLKRAYNELKKELLDAQAPLTQTQHHELANAKATIHSQQTLIQELSNRPATLAAKVTELEAENQQIRKDREITEKLAMQMSKMLEDAQRKYTEAKIAIDKDIAKQLESDTVRDNASLTHALKDARKDVDTLIEEREVFLEEHGRVIGQNAVLAAKVSELEQENQTLRKQLKEDLPKESVCSTAR